MSFLTIDGAQGEGGGQVLRTALSLSILTQTPIKLINIRAKRKKSGLLRQHLTSVLAAQQICNATTQGVKLGATSISFVPNQVKAGNYHFAIGTAGSTVLVCQTILPVLALADTPSTITFEGGTHNGMSPSLCFLKAAYLPVIKAMGVNSHITTSALGFYPAGGGKWQLTITPSTHFKPVKLLNAGSEFAKNQQNCSFKSLLSDLPQNIGEKEIATGRAVLGWNNALGTIEHYKTNGSGNSFQTGIKGELFSNLFEQVGQLGVSSVKVAKRCTARVKTFLQAQAAVEAHLADQLLVPMALAGEGEFTTTMPSQHTLTNIAVIKQFLNISITVQQHSDLLWHITINNAALATKTDTAR